MTDTPNDILLRARSIGRKFAREIDPEIERALTTEVVQALVNERRRNGNAERRADPPVDHVARAQTEARAAHAQIYGNPPPIGETFPASAEVETPLGMLEYHAWRTLWRGEREVWAGRYILDGIETPIRELRRLGLAERKYTRIRVKRNAEH